MEVYKCSSRRTLITRSFTMRPFGTAMPYATVPLRVAPLFRRFRARGLPRRGHPHRESNPPVAAQTQRVMTVVGLGSVTSTAAIVTKASTHSVALALGVAAIVALVSLAGVIVAIRTEQSKELAEAHEQRRLVNRATSGWLWALLAPKNADVIRKAALEYRKEVCMHPGEHQHSASNGADRTGAGPTSAEPTAASVPPQRLNGTDQSPRESSGSAPDRHPHHQTPTSG